MFKDLAQLSLLGVSFIASLILALLINTAIIYFTWNAVIPALFGLTTINFTQSIWLSLLSTALFKKYTSSSSKKA